MVFRADEARAMPVAHGVFHPLRKSRDFDILQASYWIADEPVCVIVPPGAGRRRRRRDRASARSARAASRADVTPGAKRARAPARGRARRRDRAAPPPRNAGRRCRVRSGRASAPKAGIDARELPLRDLVVRVLREEAVCAHLLDRGHRDREVARAGRHVRSLFGLAQEPEEARRRGLLLVRRLLHDDEERAAGRDRRPHVPRQRRGDDGELRVVLEVTDVRRRGPDERRAASEEVLVRDVPRVVVATREAGASRARDQSCPATGGAHGRPRRRRASAGPLRRTPLRRPDRRARPRTTTDRHLVPPALARPRERARDPLHVVPGLGRTDAFLREELTVAVHQRRRSVSGTP